MESYYKSDIPTLEKFGLSETDKLIIPIGGWCGVAHQTRVTFKANELSLPFDYIISTLNAIIKTIENNFEDFFENIRKIKVGPDNPFLTSNYFYFIHHDVSNPDVRLSFLSKFERFKNLLNCNRDVIFIRSCIENITNELSYLDDFKRMIKSKTNLKSWKLILVTQNYNWKSEELSTLRMNFDNQIYVFCINGFPDKITVENKEINFSNYPHYINYNLMNLIHIFLKGNENKLILKEWTDEEKKAKKYDNGYTGNTYDSHTLQFMNIIDTAIPI
jgi:hypothetical protein